MKVKTLINALKHMNPDADVLVQNDSMYYDGLYYANRSEVKPYEDNTVVIGTNHKRKVDSWDD